MAQERFDLELSIDRRLDGDKFVMNDVRASAQLDDCEDTMTEDTLLVSKVLDSNEFTFNRMLSTRNNSQ